MLKILSFVWFFISSSRTIQDVDSESELESSKKIRGEKFEPAQALRHEAKIFEIRKIARFGYVWDLENALRSCAARNV